MGSILSYLFGSSVSESTVDSLGLTAKDKRIVLSNWRVLWKDPNDLGVTLMIEYEFLFTSLMHLCAADHTLFSVAQVL